MHPASTPPPLLLASSSPRRKSLLALSGWIFNLTSVDVDETPTRGELPVAYVLRMAVTKAQAAADAVRPNLITRTGSLVRKPLILAADTIVADGTDILGKPVDALDAAQTLQRLRGRTHCVHTALAILDVRDDSLYTDLATTNVPMRAYTETEIRTYIASGDPFDKAGSYAIQHKGFHPVENMQGCFANVMGLPLCNLVRTLDKLGIHPKAKVPTTCQLALDYECPIYEQILQETT